MSATRHPPSQHLIAPRVTASAVVLLCGAAASLSTGQTQEDPTALTPTVPGLRASAAEIQEVEADQPEFEANLEARGQPLRPEDGGVIIENLIDVDGQVIDAAELEGQDDDGQQVVGLTADEDVEFIEISAFSEPVPLADFIRVVADALDISVTIKGNITGEVNFVRARDVPLDEALDLLIALLDQWNYALVYEPITDVYTVRQTSDVGAGFGEGDLRTTLFIPTPNVRPTGLQTAVTNYMSQTGTTLGMSYLDDIGMIVATGSPRRLAFIEDFIEKLLEVHSQLELYELPLEHLSAEAALARAIQLSSGSANVPTVTPNAGAPVTQSFGGSFDNLADRLAIAPQTNSLLFKGREDELPAVQRFLELIDRPSDITPKQYYAGPAASAIASFASSRGLGQVVTLETGTTTGGFNQNVRNVNNQQQGRFGAQQSSSAGGSTIIVDEERGQIIYYGTPAQQAEMAELIDELEVEGDRIVIREHKLENAVAEEVADLLLELVDSTRQQSGPLLPGTTNAARPTNDRAQPDNAGQGGDGAFTATSEDVFVTSYEAQNMVLVKAPLNEQPQFADLIDLLDVRRPQVNIEINIVSVTNTDESRFAVETQIVAGQFGLQNSLGLSSAGDDFLSARAAGTGLTGLTSALIRSEFVPFVLNAIESNTEGRIISSPSILVGDNQTGTINSQTEEPTTSTSQGDGSTVTSFDGFESAGTIVTVTPLISSGGYITLEFDTELSNFVGSGSAGVPPPRITNNVASLVTIPSDSTIVVGGIVVDDKAESSTGIPILKDLPLLGPLFADTTIDETETALYVFITPRIMNDLAFGDLRLQTMGPQAAAGLDPNVPELRPTMMRSSRSDAGPSVLDFLNSAGELPAGAGFQSMEVPPGHLPVMRLEGVSPQRLAPPDISSMRPPTLQQAPQQTAPQSAPPPAPAAPPTQSPSMMRSDPVSPPDDDGFVKLAPYGRVGG